MSHVELEHVDAELGRASGRRDEGSAHPLHPLAGELIRPHAERSVRDRRGRDERPTVGERQVDPLGARPSRSAPAGMSEPEQHLTLGPFPVRNGRLVGGRPALGGHGHRALGQPEPIVEADAAQLERRERGRRRDCPAAEPRVERARELRVADAERRVRDPAAPRQQVERKLDRLEMRVARDATEVRGALARRLLCPLDERPALELVVDERGGDVPTAPDETLRERDRVLHRELRAGADREVGRVCRVAEDDDVADVPGLVRHLREVEPERAVREQLAPAQLVGEQLLAEREALVLVHRRPIRRDARPPPDTRR